jgi:hypothetical protein
MEQINRRTVFKGAIATAVLATASTAIAAQATTELSQLMETWVRLENELQLEGSAIDGYERALNKSAPPLPSILFQAVPVPQGKPLSPNGAEGWTIAALDSYLSRGTYGLTERQNAASGFTVSWIELPLPLEAIDAMQAIKAARLDHDAAYRAHFADHAARQVPWVRKISEQDDVLQRIVDYRPASWAELHTKADWLRASGALKRVQECSDDMGLLEALATDILNLPLTT